MAAHIDKAIREGRMPPVIEVFVQGLAAGRFFDLKDAKRPIEQVFIKDLIPHIDATYRTMKSREARAIEGFSMGGHAAMRLGFKYPELFGAISGLAPSIMKYEDEAKDPHDPFLSEDLAYYDAIGPSAMAEKYAGVVRGRTVVVYLWGTKTFSWRASSLFTSCF